MTAPLAIDHWAALDQLGRALAAVLASAAERQAAALARSLASDSAADRRPLGAGDQLQTNNDHVSCPGKLDVVVAEDADRDLVTTDAK